MLLTFLLSAVSTAVAAPASAMPPPPKCEKPQLTLARSSDRPLIAPLGEAPPAEQIFAVLHTDFDGCVKPVSTRSNVRKR